MVQFRVLGPLEVLASGEALWPGGVRQRALLALLLVNAGESVSADRVVDELWGQRPPANAQHAVQVCVSRICKPAAEGLGPAREDSSCPA